MGKKHTISRLLSTIILLAVIGILINYIYIKVKPQYFEDFVRAEYNYGLSKFERDEKIKYDDKSSFKISSSTYNDAMYYKEVKVTPNTPYKVSCMVKTENVKLEDDSSNAGAGMCIVDTVERSKAITRHK